MYTPARRAFVGIDAGTTGCKVALFDETGALLGSGYSSYPCIHLHPGWVEQDVDIVWDGICQASRMARAAADVRDDAIQSIGLSSQRGTFILLDAQGRALAPAVLWNDSRAGEMEAVLEQHISRARYRALSGMPLSGSWSAAKLMWLARHRVDLMAQTQAICNGQEYFLTRLGAARLETDPSSLTLNGMLDIQQLDWSDEICRAAGIDQSLLPPVGVPGAMVGRLSPQAARKMDLPAGIALCRGGGDQQCAAVGSGVIRQGLAQVNIGTSAMMVAHVDDPSFVTGPAPYLGGHAVPHKWDAEGGAFSIGSSFKWWRDQFGASEMMQATREGRDAYDVLADMAAGVPAGSRGLIFHPFLAGRVTPYYDTTARGAFLGLTLNHDRASLTRALLEGCACEIRAMVDSIDHDIRGGISELRFTGGGARPGFLMQLYSDVLQRPIVSLRNNECGVLGAAILGAVGSGHFTSIDEAVTIMVKVGDTTVPNEGTKAVYSELFDIFRSTYETLAGAGLYQRIYRFQETE